MSDEPTPVPPEGENEGENNPDLGSTEPAESAEAPPVAEEERGPKLGMWHATQAKVIETYMTEEEEEKGPEEDKPKPKFQLKRYDGCKVGLMSPTKSLNFIPQPRAAHITNCVARLSWVGDYIMQKSKSFSIKAQSWMSKNSDPGMPRSMEDLKQELLAALMSSGHPGYKLSKHDLDQIAMHTGFGVDSVHVPYVIHDELIMYTEECLELRKAVKQHADVKAVIRGCVNLTKPTKSLQAKYVQLHLAFHKSLCEDHDEEDVKAKLINEFEALVAKSKKAPQTRLVADSIYDIADVWTMSTRPEAYANFLASVLQNISSRDPGAAFDVPLRIKAPGQISYMQEFLTGLYHPREIGDDDDTDEGSDQEQTRKGERDRDGKLLMFPSMRLDDAPSNPRIKRMLRRQKLRAQHMSQHRYEPKMLERKSCKPCGHESRAKEPVRSPALQSVLADDAPSKATTRRSSLHIPFPMPQTEPKPVKYRPLPACASVKPLGRLRTPAYKRPQLDGDAKFYANGRLEFTFGRACVKRFGGSVTERIGAAKNIYVDMHTVPNPPVKNLKNLKPKRSYRFPPRNKYGSPLPAIGMMTAEFQSPLDPQTARTHAEETAKDPSLSSSRSP
eukprot:TRINITY_DN5392_c0_g1_i4.p1 TRINITY_DN5392_c0_g1~~TRINITY_DN5392_c0_g1_i4.p1  ORF type:complete len:615 (+),score=111.97 TRINITY_DN5392_c0_g1_i4:191-2035(+)